MISGIGVLLLFPIALTAANPYVTLALFAPGMFCLGLPMGVAYAALQWILPNQVRGQVSALFLLVFNLGGLTLGPLLPAVLNDYLFHSEQAIGTSLAISMGIGAMLTVAAFRVLVCALPPALRRYGRFSPTSPVIPPLNRSPHPA